MKKRMAVLLALACTVMLLAACSEKAEESTFQPVEVENVSISVTDVSPTGATVTITDTNEESYVYGQWYKIEREADGKWHDVKTLVEHYGFTEEGILVGESDKLEFQIDWNWLYGGLPAGKYRLLKQVGKEYVAVTFDIVK